MSTVIERPPRHKAELWEPPKASSAVRGPSPVVLVALLALTLLAGAIRVKGLDAPDGRMDTDEARLALATDGVLQTGLPVMPTGRIYTRGLLNSYLIAPSFVILGRHDFAARLPSALAGALLVPLIFLLGRAIGGVAAGLAAASFAALAESLVSVSRSAWLPSIFLLLFTCSVYACYKGFVERRGRWQVAGAVGFCLAALSYEFAMLLPAGLALYLGMRAVRRDWSWYRGRSSLLALGLIAAGLLLFAVLALALRAGTQAGPLGEIRVYFSPRLGLGGVVFYLQSLLPDDYLLLAAALLGFPLLARVRPRGAAYLGGLLALAFFVPTVIIQVKNQARYALPVLPLLAVLAAAGTVHVARLVGRLALWGPLRSALPALALLVVFGSALSGDIAAAGRRLRQPPPGPTWVQAAQQQGLQPPELVVAEAPTVVQFYLGHDEFYVHPDDNERYVYEAPDGLRSIYTDSLLISEPGDFERLVEQPHTGRVAWLVGRKERLQYLLQRIDPNLWPSLVRSADRVIDTRDGWVLLKVSLPRRSGPASS